MKHTNSTAVVTNKEGERRGQEREALGLSLFKRRNAANADSDWVLRRDRYVYLSC